MIVRIVRPASPGAAARVNLYPDPEKTGYAIELPEGYRSLAPHRILLAVAAQDEGARGKIAQAAERAEAEGGAEIRIAFGKLYEDDYAEARVALDAYRLAAGETTPSEAEAALRAVHEAYPEYSDPAEGGGEFEATVRRFATDDFYRHHHLAVEYLAALERAPDTAPRP